MNTPRNEIRQEEQTQQQPAVKKPHKESRLGRAFRSILDGSILTRDHVTRLIPFGLFLSALIIGYIANSYYAEKTVRKTDKVRKDLKELEFEYITSKSELMQCSKQSDVARRLDSLGTGIEESLSPPFKIFAAPKKNETKK